MMSLLINKPRKLSFGLIIVIGDNFYRYTARLLYSGSQQMQKSVWNVWPTTVSGVVVRKEIQIRRTLLLPEVHQSTVPLDEAACKLQESSLNN